jgi:ABC-2 type transport system permease protein
MRAIWGFVSVVLTQQSRDRTSFFFMLVLPIAIIVIIGSSFGGPTTVEIGVVGNGDRADAVADALTARDGVEVERLTLEQAQGEIRRFDLEAAVVIQDEGGGYGILVNETSSAGFAARSTIQRVVDRVEAGVAPDAPSGVTVRSVGEARFASQGAFALTSAQNLVLFTFITALTAASLLVRARNTGVLRRALTAPVSAAAIVVGVGTGWLVLALVQTAIIVAVGALAFGVDWGDPSGAIALTFLFALVGAGAGLLLGSALDSENTVGSASAPVALVLAAIGGCMVPVEVFPDGLRTVSKITPHFWALEGWKALMFDAAGIADIGTELVVLAAFAVTLIVASAVVLRRSLVS